MKKEKIKNEKIKKAPPFSSKKFAIAVSVFAAFLIILNVCVGLLPYRFTHFDITSDKEYALSDTTRNFLSGIKEDTVIYCLDADGSNPKFEYFLKRIGNITDKLKVEFVSSEDKEISSLLNKLLEDNADKVNTHYSLIVKGKYREAFSQYSDMMYYYSENSTAVDFWQSNMIDAASYNYIVYQAYQAMSEGSSSSSSYSTLINAMLYDAQLYFVGEEYICRMAEYVGLELLPIRYALTGHGEAELDGTQVGAYISQATEYRELDLSTSKTIPKDATSILVFNPQSDISENEAKLLCDYLSGGGQVTFITDNEDLSLKNLMSVMSAFGLRAESGVVGELVEETDEEAEADEASQESEATSSVYRNDISVEINTEHASMSSLEGASVSPYITDANSILYDSKYNEQGLHFTPLLSTSDKAYIGDKKEELSARVVAAAVEGDNGAKLLWFTGGKTFEYEAVTSETEIDDALAETIMSNCYLILSSVYYVPLNYTSDVPTINATTAGSAVMSVNNDNFFWFTLIVLAAVLILSVCCIVICSRRRRA